MVGLTELESVTSCVSSRRSNQLSYRPLKLPELGASGRQIKTALISKNFRNPIYRVERSNQLSYGL